MATIKTHHDLTKVTERAFEDKDVQRQVLSDADAGIQTAILRADGTVQTVIGLNITRYLPDPYPDPLDEILRVALTTRADNN